MTQDELRKIMDDIHEAQELRLVEEKKLRQLVHDNIDAFANLWELWKFCKETTRTREEFNGVYGRLLKTWNKRRNG